MTVSLYGCETWTLNKRMWTTVHAFHMRCQRIILSIKWRQTAVFIPNVTVAATSGLESIINIARARRLGLYVHVARFSRDVPASQHPHYLLRFRRWISSNHSWRRSNGRPRTTWLDHISSDNGMSLTDIFTLVQDRLQTDGRQSAKATRIWLTV